MIQAPINDLIVQIASTYQDKIGNIWIDTRYDPTEHATLVGKVHSVPRYVVQDRPDYKGYSVKDVQVDDTVIMRYDVTSMYKLQKKDEAPTYKHYFMYKGQHYWRAAIIKCFAVIREQRIIMLNGYLMTELPPPPPKIYLQAKYKQLQRTVGVVVRYVGNPLEGVEDIGAKPGDTVYVNPRVIQTYQINGKPFCIVKQSQVCGVEIKDDKQRILALTDAGGF